MFPATYILVYCYQKTLGGTMHIPNITSRNNILGFLLSFFTAASTTDFPPAEAAFTLR